MRRPPGAEGVAAGREFADEIGERAVVGVAPGLGAQRCDEIFRHLFPVEEELLGGGIEEGEARTVGWLLEAVEQRRVQGAAELVGGQVVTARVDHGRRRADAVEDAL